MNRTLNFPFLVSSCCTRYVCYQYSTLTVIFSQGRTHLGLPVKRLREGHPGGSASTHFSTRMDTYGQTAHASQPAWVNRGSSTVALHAARPSRPEAVRRGRTAHPSILGVLWLIAFGHLEPCERPAKRRRQQHPRVSALYAQAQSAHHRCPSLHLD